MSRVCVVAVNMQDVAERAGVNRSTVSRALRGPSRDVSEEVRQRILKIADEIGYRRDPLVSALMAQRKGKAPQSGIGRVAVVSLWPSHDEGWLRQSFYEPYRKGLLTRLHQLGYGMDLFPCDGTVDACRRLLRVIRSRGIRGVIITQAHPSITELPLELDGFCVVLMGYGVRSRRLTRVESALFRNMRLAHRTVQAQGSRRIAFVTWEPVHQKTKGEWMGAYLLCSLDLPARDRLRPLMYAKFNVASVLSDLDPMRPDTVISENSWLLKQIGEQRPDWRMVSLDLDPGSWMSGIDARRGDVGAAAADLLVGQLNRGQGHSAETSQVTLVDGKWHDATGPFTPVAE